MLYDSEGPAEFICATMAWGAMKSDAVCLTGFGHFEDS